ncbi:O-unit flippase-like protein [Staphylococcus simulans]|uniref:Polysaccharide biosynthesis protein n=17 Tax=Staphylococcus simulans TaxID=1286 RepID=A0ABN0PCF0_STASI|nr:O-unit flippase-like protein [Staphylococcus simulans]AVO02475.1 hypothetical protein BI282_08655 [Staphylococcus simulans]AVO05420.1 hypothetical protein BI283_08620 [Staphylococcus simulans]AWG19022.1 hypothetical protein A9958_08665 [Staphylococcus simulans]AWI01971.1 hypothetical protein A7X73_08550 [Staphylococcus simulans]ERS93282.1 hypothetical protein SSIM_08330 [Staphylococcus simulans UMC-CNS-990]
MNIGKKDVIWGYISLAMVQGVNIFLLPIILKYLNSSELGLWYTFTSLYGFAMLIDFGFQSVISRNISYLWSGSNVLKKEGFDSEGAAYNGFQIGYFISVLSVVKFIYYVMGAIIFLVFITLGTWYIFSITSGEIEWEIALLAWLFYFVSIVLNISFSYWNAVLKGIGAIKTYNQILVITKVMQLLVSVILLIMGYGIIGVSVAYLISVIINRLLQSTMYYNYSKTTKKTRKKIKFKYDAEIFKAIIPNTIKTGLLSLSNYLIINFPILLASYFLSLKISGQFGLVNQVVTLILTLSNSYFNTYLSQINYLRVKNNQHKILSLFKKSIITNYAFNIFSFILLLALGNPILNFINYEYGLLPLIPMLIILIYRFLYNNQILFTTFLTTKNIIPHYKSFLVSATITVVIQILVLSVFDANLITLLLPLLIVQLVHNNWYWVLYVLKDIRSDYLNVTNE